VIPRVPAGMQRKIALSPLLFPIGAITKKYGYPGPDPNEFFNILRADRSFLCYTFIWQRELPA
jgi:hypothetical protein